MMRCVETMAAVARPSTSASIGHHAHRIDCQPLDDCDQIDPDRRQRLLQVVVKFARNALAFVLLDVVLRGNETLQIGVRALQRGLRACLSSVTSRMTARMEASPCSSIQRRCRFNDTCRAVRAQDLLFDHRGDRGAAVQRKDARLRQFERVGVKIAPMAIARARPLRQRRAGAVPLR